MKNKKSLPVSLLSLVILCFGYLTVRFALFAIHGMKDWPLFLFVSCVVVIAISTAVGAKLLPLATSFSYIVGFALAYLLKTEAYDQGGGKTDNLWIIWTIVIIAVTTISAVAEFVKAKKANEN